MKIIVTEKQMKLITGSVIDDLSEEEDTASAQPSAGTSSSGSKQVLLEVQQIKSVLPNGQMSLVQH
jgi:hypothetical protein